MTAAMTTEVPEPVVMGVVNVTPDSFSDGGEWLDPDAAIAHGRELVAQGAQILDVGGESTRPGAEPVGAAEELRRVVPGARRARRRRRAAVDRHVQGGASPRPRSTPARRSSTTSRALRGDPAMAGARRRARLRRLPHAHARRAAHDAARPQSTTTSSTTSRRSSRERLRVRGRAGHRRAARLAGPGHRLRQDVDHNLELLRACDELARARPAARRRDVAQVVSRHDHRRARPRRSASPGTIATNVLALARGASIFRVHDVAEARDALAVAAATLRGRWDPATTTSTNR